MKKVVLMLLVISMLMLVGCSSTDEVKVPSGNDCGENVAYLQQGVDKYNEALGTYPANVDELLEAKDGKGPFVEVVPECPSGNIYVINNGVVGEAPPQ